MHDGSQLGIQLGIDLGTSAVKAVLVEPERGVLCQASAPLLVSRPRNNWSEQEPADWWAATQKCVNWLRAAEPERFRAVRAIGLSGQMHGATLLAEDDRVLRPCILWNDGRSADECRELEEREPRLRAITGNRAMPGFTAPKLLWVARHEPELFGRLDCVLLPKDMLRLRLTGERVSDCSDASGTLWLDVGARRWSPALLAACSLGDAQMPRLVEGSEVSGVLRDEWASAWGLTRGIPVAGGGGDQAAGAVGAGVVEPGHAFVSLGTSGVVFAAGERFAPRPERGLHAFCHALPGRWHQMAVILSAASCLAWLVRATGARDEQMLLSEVEAQAPEPGGPLFLPYLSGERTPHNDPHARGAFFGLDHETRRADLTRAVLEGVAFALAEGAGVLAEAGTRPGRMLLIGGGARSLYWARLLASALDRPLGVAAEAEIGPALGAARLARLALSGESPESVCTPPPLRAEVEPVERWRGPLAERRARFGALYAALRDHFPTRSREPG